LELHLEQKQIQKLSPKIVQALEVLQMSSLELQEYIETLLLENPVLEQDDVPPQEEFPLLSRPEWKPRPTPSVRSRNLMDTMSAPSEESLADHLSAQIPWKYLSPEMRCAVECVLTGLNDNGWLEESAEELACRCGVSPDVIAGAEYDASVIVLKFNGIKLSLLPNLVPIMATRHRQAATAPNLTHTGLFILRSALAPKICFSLISPKTSANSSFLIAQIPFLKCSCVIYGGGD